MSLGGRVQVRRQGQWGVKGVKTMHAWLKANRTDLQSIPHALIIPYFYTPHLAKLSSTSSLRSSSGRKKSSGEVSVKAYMCGMKVWVQCVRIVLT